MSWYEEQINAESIVSRNVNSVRRDAIISTISKMLEVRAAQILIPINWELTPLFIYLFRTVPT